MELLGYLWLYFVALAITIWIHTRWIVSVPRNVRYILRRSYRFGSNRFVALGPGKHIVPPFVHAIEQNYLTKKVIELPTTHNNLYVDSGFMRMRTKNDKLIGIEARFSVKISNAAAFCEQYQSHDVERPKDIARNVVRDTLTKIVNDFTLADRSTATAFESSVRALKMMIQQTTGPKEHPYMKIKWHSSSIIAEIVTL